MLGSEAGLSNVVKADCEVEQVIRMVTFGGNGIKKSLLRFRPASLAGVEIPQGEVERG
jgi:hypothetical protein